MTQEQFENYNHYIAKNSFTIYEDEKQYRFIKLDEGILCLNNGKIIDISIKELEALNKSTADYILVETFILFGDIEIKTDKLKESLESISKRSFKLPIE